MPFSKRAARWFRGREAQKNSRFDIISENRSVVWFHASSLGEYEQGLPVIKKWQLERPDDFILLTFFSPSGYSIQKDNTQVDRVIYLPRERLSEIKPFLDAYNPSLAVFIKYEIWPVLLNELRDREIPTYLISAVFRKNQVFFKCYGKWYLSLLKNFDNIYVQDPESLQLLGSKGIRNAKVCGDTRIDRVVELLDQEKEILGIKEFKGDNRIIIAGSSWQLEESFLHKFFLRGLPDKYKIIIAPHDVEKKHLNAIKKQLGDSIITYTDLLKNQESGEERKILLIDRVGILSRIYRYGDIAFIGGGFGSGLHNILEPAVYGLPIIFGRRYKNFIEAIELIKTGGAVSVKSYVEFEDKIMSLINDENTLSTASKGCRDYVNKSKGASGLITSQLLEKVQQ